MSKYELEVKGFDGSSDDTDDLILWVSADNEHIILDAMRLGGISPEAVFVTQRLPESVSMDIDFELPAQAGAFASRVRELLDAHTQTNETQANDRDAERYRWMRNNFDDNWGGPYFRQQNGSFVLKQQHDLDAAVDAAMANKTAAAPSRMEPDIIGSAARMIVAARSGGDSATAMEELETALASHGALRGAGHDTTEARERLEMLRNMRKSLKSKISEIKEQIRQADMSDPASDLHALNAVLEESGGCGGTVWALSEPGWGRKECVLEEIEDESAVIVSTPSGKSKKCDISDVALSRSDDAAGRTLDVLVREYQERQTAPAPR